MAKTKETLMLEEALYKQSTDKREYGCTEVTIGFKGSGHGDEIVDYMSMDSKRIFKCYELKVSLSDLKTDNALSYYGDYNYLVVTKELYQKAPVWDNYIPPYCGILVGEELTVRRRAVKKTISEETRSMLEDSLIRSLYWKYTQYRDAANLEVIKSLQKQLEEKDSLLEEVKRENDRKIWTYNDYERFYALNHQDPSFTIDRSAQKERKQYFLRRENRYTWIKEDDHFICPCCNKAVDEITPFCPYCGSDLRTLDE